MNVKSYEKSVNPFIIGNKSRKCYHCGKNTKSKIPFCKECQYKKAKGDLEVFKSLQKFLKEYDGFYEWDSRFNKFVWSGAKTIMNCFNY